MSTISSMLSAATWQGWSLSSASSILGYETEGSDPLGDGFLASTSADLVTLSAEAQAVLDAQEEDGDSLDLSSVMDQMSASQVASLSQTVAAGEVVSSMMGDLDSLDILSGLSGSTGSTDEFLSALLS